jgi:hypothetical protein
MISTAPAIEKMTLSITEEIRVQAPIDVTFATLLEQLGPLSETMEGQSMNMKIEPWPGGRWYRDLGDGNGHFGGMCRRLSGQLYWRSADRCSCRIQSSRTCSTD